MYVHSVPYLHSVNHCSLVYEYSSNTVVICRHSSKEWTSTILKQETTKYQNIKGGNSLNGNFLDSQGGGEEKQFLKGGKCPP